MTMTTADQLRTGCGQGADRVRTSCGPAADQLRTIAEDMMAKYFADESAN